MLACWRHILGVIKIPSDTEVAPRYKLSSLLTLEHLRCEWCQRSISSWCLCLILFWHSWRRNSAKKYVHQLVFQVAHSTCCLPTTKSIVLQTTTWCTLWTTEAERNLKLISDALFRSSAGDYLSPTFKTAIKQQAQQARKSSFFRKSIRKMPAPCANI